VKHVLDLSSSVRLIVREELLVLIDLPVYTNEDAPDLPGAIRCLQIWRNKILLHIRALCIHARVIQERSDSMRVSKPNNSSVEGMIRISVDINQVIMENSNPSPHTLRESQCSQSGLNNSSILGYRPGICTNQFLKWKTKVASEQAYLLRSMI
jgi:hypothetical protein